MASRKVRRVVNLAEADITRRVQKLILDIAANLKEETPVDTGWARANWVPAIRRPYRANGERPRTNPEGRAQVRRAKQTAGEIGIHSYEFPDKAFVSNNVPYVPILDDRHPTAAGFIQESVDKAIRENE